MTACEVVKHILMNCESIKYFRPFMFGSSLKGIGSDFDILIVGPGGEPLFRLKKELEVAGNELPLDILYMLPAEAEDSNFIAKAGCVSFEELANREKSD